MGTQFSNCLFNRYCFSNRDKEKFGRSFKWRGTSFQRSTTRTWIDCSIIRSCARLVKILFQGISCIIIMYLIGILKSLFVIFILMFWALFFWGDFIKWVFFMFFVNNTLQVISRCGGCKYVYVISKQSDTCSNTCAYGKQSFTTTTHSKHTACEEGWAVSALPCIPFSRTTCLPAQESSTCLWPYSQGEELLCQQRRPMGWG